MVRDGYIVIKHENQEKMVIVNLDAVSVPENIYNMIVNQDLQGLQNVDLKLVFDKENDVMYAKIELPQKQVSEVVV
ncbi:MAG: hypothetical protein QXX12_01365 [Nanopusillaceae archaeon]